MPIIRGAGERMKIEKGVRDCRRRSTRHQNRRGAASCRDYRHDGDQEASEIGDDSELPQGGLEKIRSRRRHFVQKS